MSTRIRGRNLKIVKKRDVEYVVKESTAMCRNTQPLFITPPQHQLVWTLVSSQNGIRRPNDVEMIAIVWKGLAQSYHIFVMTGRN